MMYTHNNALLIDYNRKENIQHIIAYNIIIFNNENAYHNKHFRYKNN